MKRGLLPILLVCTILIGGCGSADTDDESLGETQLIESDSVDTTQVIDVAGEDAPENSADGPSTVVDGSDTSAGEAESDGSSSTDGSASSDESSSGGSSTTDANGSTETTKSSTEATAGATTTAGNGATTAPPETASGATTTVAPRPSSSGSVSGLTGIDWWGCWDAADARGSGGGNPGNGGRVSTLPNCATGPSSVGSAGDMFGSANPPVFRPSGVRGGASIEFTHNGDTLLQTNGGQPWGGGDVLAGSSQGVTVAWIGVMTDIASHEGKYLVSGLNRSSRFPSLRVIGRGPDRFEAYGGGAIEAASSSGLITDGKLFGVIAYLDPGQSASVMHVNRSEVRGGQNSQMRRDVAGLTLGNFYSLNNSTTDHQFLFLGLNEGELSDAEKSAFWNYVDSL